MERLFESLFVLEVRCSEVGLAVRSKNEKDVICTGKSNESIRYLSYERYCTHSCFEAGFCNEAHFSGLAYRVS